MLPNWIGLMRDYVARSKFTTKPRYFLTETFRRCLRFVFTWVFFSSLLLWELVHDKIYNLHRSLNWGLVVTFTSRMSSPFRAIVINFWEARNHTYANEFRVLAGKPFYTPSNLEVSQNQQQDMPRLSDMLFTSKCLERNFFTGDNSRSREHFVANLPKLQQSSAYNTQNKWGNFSRGDFVQI